LAADHHVGADGSDAAMHELLLACIWLCLRPPNVGVSRAAGRRDQERWQHELARKSRAQVGGCASSVGLHAMLGGLSVAVPHWRTAYAGVFVRTTLIGRPVRHESDSAAHARGVRHTESVAGRRGIEIESIPQYSYFVKIFM
jgi:hypothetical protein